MILFLVSVLQINTDPGYVRASFRFICECGITLILAVFIYQKVNRWIGLFLGLVLFSSVYPSYTIHSLLARNAVIFWCLWYSILILTVKNEKALLNVICLIALINVGFQILQFFDIDPIHKAIYAKHDIATGLLSNTNSVSALLAFCFPAFLRSRWKWLIPVVIIGLFLARSVGGILSVAVGIILYAHLKGKIYFSLAITFLGILLYCLFVDAPGIERWEVWKKGLALSTQHWILGSGIGHWKVILLKFEIHGTPWRTAHNEFLQIYFEMGIGVLIILTGYFMNIIRRFRRSNIKHHLPLMALTIIIINSIVNFPFHIATTAIVAVTWMAILETQLRGNNAKC